MEDVQAMIEDCEKRESKLSDWERGFIDSISEQFARHGGLTPKQYARLEEIWNKVT